MRRLSVAIALLCAGCASTMAGDDDRVAESLAEVQSFTDATTRAYKLQPVKVVLRDTETSWIPIRQMDVTRALLVAPIPVRDARVAMLLGFWVVNPTRPMSESQEIALNRQIYPERNVAAVDILTTVKGLPPAVGVAAVYRMLEDEARAVAQKRASPARNAPHPCDQLVAMVRDFPGHKLDRVSACPEPR